MSGTPPPARRRRRREAAAFRPNFLLVILYLGTFTVVFGLVIAGPDLFGAWRETTGGAEAPSPEELRRAGREAARQAMGGGRLLVAFLAAAFAVGVGAWARVLPGFR
jgi:hypothetical protein